MRLPTRALTSTCATSRAAGSAGAVATGIDGIPDPFGHLPLRQARNFGEDSGWRHDGHRVEVAAQTLAVDADLVRHHQVELLLFQLLLCLGAQIFGLSCEADAKEPGTCAKRLEDVDVGTKLKLHRLLRSMDLRCGGAVRNVIGNGGG